MNQKDVGSIPTVAEICEVAQWMSVWQKPRSYDLYRRTCFEPLDAVTWRQGAGKSVPSGRNAAETGRRAFDAVTIGGNFSSVFHPRLYTY